MSGRSAARGTIVVVEDNPMLLQGLDRALTASGYRVETASCGEAALEMLESADFDPDLLLLDVMMPGLSGFDVLRTLRADPERKHVPVVMITAATDRSVRETAHHQGATDLLIKPFHLGELLERIDRHVGSGHRGSRRDAPTRQDRRVLHPPAG